MEPNDLFEIQIGNVASIINPVTRDKMSHLRESVHNHHNGILPSLSPNESHNEVHAHIFLGLNRYGQWGIKALVKLTLDFVAYRTY